MIVGNTTKRRHKVVSPDLALSVKEQQILDEQGGFSGPQMFERTLGLVKRYRKLLDQGPPPESESKKPVAGIPTGDEPGSTIAEKIEAVKESLVGSGGASEGQHKVIFATGGITNGKQALEILNAGASVAQIYTAMVYGGSGTVTRIKREMKEEISNKKK